MGIFTFGEFVSHNNISLKSEAHMKEAFKRYDKAFERTEFEVWAIDMAAKYFEYERDDIVWVDDNTWKSVKAKVDDDSETITYGCDGWIWNATYMEWFNGTECWPYDMETDANEPGMLFYMNPVTGQWSDPYCFEYFDDYKEYIYPGVEDEESLYPIMRKMRVPGFNHGWDEEELEKEAHLNALHAWGRKAWADDFYEEISWVYSVLDEYDSKH